MTDILTRLHNLIETEDSPAMVELCSSCLAEIELLRAELAATRERAICYRTEYPYCDADLDMHAEAMVATERERWESGIRRELSRELAEEVIAAIRKGEP